MELTNLLTQDAQTALAKWKKWLKKLADPLGKAFEPTAQGIKETITPVVEDIKTVTTDISKPIVEPIKKSIQKADKIGKINSFLQEKGITVDTIKQLAEADGTDPQVAFDFFKKNGIKVQGMEEMEQQQQAVIDQWPDLWVMWSIGQGITWAFRVWEQIPRYAWNIAWLAFRWLGEWSGLIWRALWVENEDNPFYQSGIQLQESTTWLGESITRAWEGDVTEKERQARRFWANVVSTGLVPLGTASKFVQGAWLGKTALRWAVAWGMGTPLYTTIEESRLPTLWEMAIWTTAWAVLWPVLEKWVIPAVSGIVNKTGKYGKAFMEWGVKWAWKSISRDISAMKEGIKKPVVTTTTRYRDWETDRKSTRLNSSH